jgi:hypothetical protein
MLNVVGEVLDRSKYEYQGLYTKSSISIVFDADNFISVSNTNSETILFETANLEPAL